LNPCHFRKQPLKPFKLSNRFSDRLAAMHSSPASLHSPELAQPSAIMDTIRSALNSAGLTSCPGLIDSVTTTIDQALASAGLHGARSGNAGARTCDAVVQHVPPVFDAGVTPAPSSPRNDAPRVAPGEFLARSFSNDAGTRAYKLYVPTSWHAAGERVALVIMLHGCTQTPDDFATGTRMNALAEQHGFIVAYPEQTANANVSRCWNWFRTQDQARASGEPSLIAGITREIVATYSIDERRIFVAGLSAGAAMAVVLAANYPELYAAVGVHSGLPFGSASDIASAFAAMRGHSGRVDSTTASVPAVPTIIFHGDRDATVHASNADAIAKGVHQAAAPVSSLARTVEHGHAGGRAYTRVVLVDGTNPALLEQWTVHGSGHAWSGGDQAGTFTDPSGPDASSQMIRFFLSQRRAGTA